MATLSPAIRSGPLLVLLVALAVSPASANDSHAHRYSIVGSLTPSSPSTATGGNLQLKSHLAGVQTEIPAQVGGNIALIARLAYSPMVCFGDTIFMDGFDP